MGSQSKPGTGREPAWSVRAIEDEAEEGLLLAEYATRMRLKNRIIVDTMTAAGVVDADAWADEARLSLGRLRIEAEASARRMRREREVAATARGRARHQHDYRAGDTGALEKRERVYRLVARRLLSWENDGAQVAALLAAARQDAAEEMDAALVAALSGDGASRVEDEALLRDRMRLVVDVDLPALRRASAASTPPASAPPPATPASLPPGGWVARLARRLRRRPDRAAGKGVRPPR